jgi:hypothetical protein|tara:strand:+ start:13533 stop:14756 length:1224 start_codon:yes stop_codon:yes gene_type:complete
MTKKSILEEALLEAQALEEAVKTNAKEILASTMKEEIEELVKESLNEQEIEFDAEEEDEVMDDEMIDVDDDEESDVEFDLTVLPEPEQGGVDYDEEPLDLRNASDDEILKVFKLMGDSDGVIVTQDDDVIDIVDDGAGVEYKVELGESTLEDEILESLKSTENEETVFEIEINEDEEDGLPEDEDAGDGPVPEGEHEEEANEASRTYGFGSKSGRGLRKSFTDNRNKTFQEGTKKSTVKESKRKPTSRRTVSIQKKYNQLVEHSKNQNELVEKLMIENKNMKSKVSEYKNALGDFRTKINEVAVFNRNLAYATKLFTEHSTSKEEKINIMRRFDSVGTLNEGKNLYDTIKTELVKTPVKTENTKTINESIAKKITRTPKTGSTNLIENKVYESPQISRIKDMMSKLS